MTSTDASPRDAGFALVVVLLALGLLGTIAASFSLAVRAHLRATAAQSVTARAEALADGGINLAVQDLIAARDDRTRARRYPVTGTRVACRFEDAGRLMIEVQDEAGRVDLNTASEALLRALLGGSGVGAGEAAKLVDRILDYRDRDEDRRPLGAERPDYRAAGLPGPKNAPLDAVDELHQVLGADARLLERIRPLITVHSGLAGVDPKAMSVGQAALIAAGDAAAGGGLAPGARPAGPGLLPPRFVDISPQQVFSIRSEAETSDGGRYVREAVVDLGPRRSRALVFKRWVRGSAPAAQTSVEVSAATLPPC